MKCEKCVNNRNRCVECIYFPLSNLKKSIIDSKTIIEKELINESNSYEEILKQLNSINEKINDMLGITNEEFNNLKRTYLYTEYIPTCPKGYIDCISDPAYIKYHHPNWYKELYGEKTPEEVSKEECDINDEYCYDDEDK